MTTYIPELRKEMVWLEQSRTDLVAMFEMLPEDGEAGRAVHPPRPGLSGDAQRLNRPRWEQCTSALTI